MTAIDPPRHPARVNPPYTSRLVPPVVEVGSSLQQVADRQALERIIAARPSVTTELINGRPVRIYLERPRLAWAATIGRVVLVLSPMLLILAAAALVMRIAVTHTAAVMGITFGVVALVAGKVAGRRGRAGHGLGCAGLHCRGCGSR